MKRLIVMVLAMMFMATPMVNAQRVNKQGLIDRMASTDAAVNDAKKGKKAATWISRGDAYYKALTEPTKGLFAGIEYAAVEITMGMPESKTEGVVLNGITYTEMTYPWVKIYVANNRVVTWEQTQTVSDKDFVQEVFASYMKAYEIDRNQAGKVEVALNRLANYLLQVGNACQDLTKWAEAAENYYKAYDVKSYCASLTLNDAQYLYFAGYLWVLDGNIGSKSQESYRNAVMAFDKALAAGYTDEKGDIYNFLYHAYNGQTDSAVRTANMQRAKQLLIEGLAKFPSNDNIIAALIDVYTSGENMGDPTELVDMIDKALERDPKNRDMWFGRGKVFYSLKNYDESIVSFKKVIELEPQNAQATFFIGYFYIAKGDAMGEEINKRDYKSSAEWKADAAKVTEVYKEAIPYLEKAYELNPKDFSTVETLKILTFKLRDEEGMMDKYTKYNKLYEEMKALQ